MPFGHTFRHVSSRRDLFPKSASNSRQARAKTGFTLCVEVNTIEASGRASSIAFAYGARRLGARFDGARRLCGRPGVSPARRPRGRILHGGGAAGGDGRSAGDRRRGATLRPGRGNSRPMVGAVPLRGAGSMDPRGAREQSDAGRRRGHLAACAGDSSRPRRRPPSKRRRERERVPAEAVGGFLRGGEPADQPLHPVQRLGERLVHPRPVREDAPRAGGVAGAGRLPGFPAGGRLSHAHVQHRDRGLPGGLPARAVAGDAGDPRDAGRAARVGREAVRAGRDRADRRARPAGLPGPDPGDPSPAGETARPDAPPAGGPCRQVPRRHGGSSRIRPEGFSIAGGAPGEPAVVAGAPTPGHPVRRGSSARGERRGRRRHGEPLPANHAVRPVRDEGVRGSATCSDPAPPSGGSGPDSCSPSFTAVRCKRPAAPRSPATTRPRRSTARRSCRRSARWPTCSGRWNTTR